MPQVPASDPTTPAAPPAPNPFMPFTGDPLAPPPQIGTVAAVPQNPITPIGEPVPIPIPIVDQGPPPGGPQGFAATGAGLGQPAAPGGMGGADYPMANQNNPLIAGDNPFRPVGPRKPPGMAGIGASIQTMPPSQQIQPPQSASPMGGYRPV